MKRNPLYIFDDLESKGINQVPMESTVQINDIDGDPFDNNPTPMIIQIVGDAGIDEFTTIGQFLLMTDNYVDINESSRIESELEKITQIDVNGFEKTGWRVLGRNPRNYGLIGREAIDLTASPDNVNLINTWGATGTYALTGGYRTTASGWSSTAFGHYTLAPAYYSFAAGSYNKGESLDNIVEFGCGTSANLRKNALEITKDGMVVAPEMTTDFLSGPGILPETLITKAYSDANIDSKYDKTGGIINGDVLIEGANPTIDVSFVNNGWAHFKQGITIDKSLTVGGDQAGTSTINFKDTNPINKPAITWQGGKFYITTNAASLQEVWHAGNDGMGSGLDADKIQGILGTDLATKANLQSGLSTKLDVLGGTIDGDLVVTGRTEVHGVIDGITMDLSSNAVIHGRLDVEDDATFTNPVTTINKFSPNSIDSTVNFKKGSLWTGSTSVTTIESPFNFYKDSLHIKLNSDQQSIISFEDANQISTEPSFFWDSNTSGFYIKEADGVPHKVYHDGIAPPGGGGSTTFDGLTDTPPNKLGSDGYYLQVQGSEIAYVDSSSLSPVWGNIGGVLANQSDLQLVLDSKLSTAGGTITTLTTISDLNVGTNLTVGGVAEIPTADMGTITSDVQFSDNVVIDEDLNVTGTGTIGVIRLGYDSNNDGTIKFSDDGSGGSVIYPRFYWSNTTHDFRYDDAVATNRPLAQSGGGGGGVDPDAPVNFTSSVTISVGPFVTKDITINGSFINIIGDSAGDSGITTQHYPGGTLDPNITPKIYWSSSQGQWVVDGMLPGGGQFVGARLWNDISFSPGTKYDKIGGLIQGDVDIQPNAANNKNGDLNVQGSLTVHASEINFSNLPTNPAGLNQGQLWDDSGTLKIVQ